MRRDSRLSGVLHVMVHMTSWPDPTTSEVLAQAMETNPVVIRRMLAGLRARGFVRSEKGHGGGWTLDCDPACVTLRDIYEALGSPSILAIGNRSDSPTCLVEQGVNAVLTPAFAEIEATLLARLGEVTLADLAAEVESRKRGTAIRNRGASQPSQCT
jgi:DNA-binding IscR family transcriptional regulator